MEGTIGRGSPGFGWVEERERLHWAVRVRWAVIIGLAVLLLGMHAFGIFADIGWVIAAGSVGAAINGLNHLAVRRARAIIAATVVAVVMDNVLITFAAARTGGFHSPIVIFFSVQVVATAMLVDARWALLSAALAGLC